MAKTPAPSGRESHRRSLAKAVSWRITGNPVIAGAISAVEIVTKIVLFYVHERIWGKIRWGKR